MSQWTGQRAPQWVRKEEEVKEGEGTEEAAEEAVGMAGERGVRAEEPREGEMVDPSYDTSQAAVMAKGAENRPGRRGWG